MTEEAKEKIDDWIYLHVYWLKRVYYKYCTIRMWVIHFFQKMFRKSHVSDKNCWDLNSVLAKDISRYLTEFKKYPRQGTPTPFVDYEKDDGYCSAWESKEDYDKEHVGGGFAKWNETIDEMVFGFEYVLADTDVWDEDSKWFYSKYDINKEEYVERASSKIAGEKFTYEKFKEDKRKEMYERHKEGLRMFGEYFMNLGD